MVLIVTCHRLADLALAVSLEGLSARFPSAAPNLFILYIDPVGFGRGTGQSKLPVPLMAQKILQSSLFRNLIEVAPGLKELFLLGRMQELAERRSDDSHQSLSSPYELFSFNVTPQKPFNAPPVPIQPLTEWTKGLWAFNDGSAVYAAGPAHSRIVPLSDGSWLFTVTTAQIITSGIGKYANAYGVKQATGSAFVPASLVASGHFPLPGLMFQAHTIEVFRIFVPSA